MHLGFIKGFQMIDALISGQLNLKDRLTNILVSVIATAAGDFVGGAFMEDLASDIAGALVGFNSGLMLLLFRDWGREMEKQNRKKP